MIKTTAPHSWTRTFVACLIISLLVLSPLAPLAPVASAAPKVSTPVATVAPVEPAAAPFVPSITATKTDSFPDLDGDGKAAPGETITYDVNVTNNGDDATGVTFTDMVDANTTLVGGSLKVSPLAFADSYVAAKDTQLVVGTPGVLVNDTGLPAPTAVAIAGGATTQGGTVTLNTDGSFTYNPAAGFTGADTFNYTVTNGLTPNDTAQVTINVDAPPSVTATTPTNGATNQANNTDITITFSEAVNVTGNWFQIVCTSSGTRNVADTVVTGGPTTFTINPNLDFTQNETCTVTVAAAQVSDQDANDPPDNMTADFVFSFTTTDAAPSVASTTPTDGAANQNTNVNIDITFSEPVNVTGNWFQIVCGTSGTRNVADTVVTGGPSAFTINPNADFAAAETCTVTVFAAQVTDQDSDDPPDNMAANFVFSFSTEAAPAVNATTPTNGATQVPNNTNVTVTFSEPVDVTGNWFQIVGATSGTRNVADTVVTGGPTMFTINPNVDFANGELVTVTVFAAQVTDQDTGDPPDTMAANFVFSFTIDQAPAVNATTPTNGATNQALNTNVSITFSEPVNVTGNWFQISCTTTGTRNVADTVVTGGPTTFTINPNADFTTSETCTVTVSATQVTDQDSGDPPDNMTANFVFSFQTIDAAPTVTATTPTNGATNQATDTNITITFSEPVNVTGNWFQSVCASSGTRNVADTVVTGGPTTFTINPNTDFTASESCTVTIAAAQVADQDTNDPPDTMAANFVFSFTIDGPPAVTTTTPSNGATQVAANTNITINFNENVNIQDSTAFTVECPVATPIAFNVTPVAPGGTNSFVIDPTADLPLGTVCTVTVVASKVTDVDAGDPPDNMAANFVFSFTTDQAPSVTGTTPANNANDVAQNSTITINFSENVDVAADGVTINCGSVVAFTPALPQNNITSLVLTPTGGLPAGSTCTVTVDKTKISDTDAGDPPDNMVNDFVFSFKVKPDAVNDTYPNILVGNVSTNSALIPFSITTNDVSANAFSITAVQASSAVVANTITTTSVNGGTIIMTVSGADRGKFAYNPPAGFEGTDTFSYVISRDDGGGTDTAIVSIPISGMIWFVNNSASCPCDGRLSNPFNTLAAFQAVNNGAGNNPAINDNIFVYESGTAYVGPVTLLNGQKFIGQDATVSLSTITGLTPPLGSAALPVMNSANGTITNITSAGIGITVAQNNTLRGFTGGNAVPDIIGSGFGTLTIADVILNGTGQALSLTNGTLNASFVSISSSNSATTGISLTTVAGSLTSGSTTISNPTGIGISVNTSSGALNFGNTAATLSGGTGVSLTTNTGSITFGALDISPDANQRGLLATDNTNTITSSSGTLVTSGATAVEISRASSTTPLAVALTSISTTGGPNGIFLRNTSGSFSVNGDGANTTVGGNFTGGTISGMTGADGATAGNAVYLENAGNVTLRRIRINGANQNHGIRGVNSSNFTLEFSNVTGTNGTSAALDEGAVNFDNLTGTAAITSCIIEGGFEDNLNVINTSGTLNRLTISGTTFGFNGSGTGNNNIQIESLNAGTTLNFTLKSSLIKGARADFLNALASSGSTMDAVIGGPLVADGNTFDNLAPNNHPTSAAGGNRVVTTAVGTQTVDIRNNILKGSRGEAIRVRSTISSPLRGNVNARVRNNTIGVAGTANSGSSESFGVFIFSDGGASMTAAVTNNQIVQYNNSGIHMTIGDQMGGAPVNNVTVTGNTVNTPGNANPAANFNAIHLDHGTIDIPADSFTSCIDIGGAGVGNNVAGGGKGAISPNNNDIRVRQRQATTVRLPGYGGANNDNAAVVAYLTGRNTLTTAAAANTVPTGGGFIGGAACTAPTVAAASIAEDSPVGSLSAESLTTGVQAAVERGDNTLFATKGEDTNAQNVVSLTQSEVSAMAQAAIARWAEAGLSARNMAKLQALSFEIADLPAGQLATATSSKITLDETAAGYGWFFDATPSDDNEFEVSVHNKELQTTDTSAANGRIDLLTVLMRQLGSQVSFGKSGPQGPAAWLMEGTLSTGERRAPEFKVRELGKVLAPKGANAVLAGAKSRVAEQPRQQIASVNEPRSSRNTARRHHAMLTPRAAAPMSFADVMLNIGTLPAGKSITIKFDVTVDDPFLGNTASVSNQGIVSGTNFANVLTDDPDVGGAADPTVTPIDLQADLEVMKTDSPDPVIAGNNITYTINFKNNGPNATGATVTDAIPTGTTFVSAAVTTGTGWSIMDPGVGNTGNVVFSKTSVADEETAVFQLVVKVGSGVAGGSTINNSATAATTGATDPVPGNNTGTASTSVIAQADLSITKTDGATEEIPGTSVSYTIVVSNAGPSDANGVTVSDTFPGILTGVTFTSVAAGGATGNTAAGNGNISDTVNMPAGSSITYTVNATIQSSATGNLTNTATVTEPVGVTDPTQGNNSATDTDTLTPQADLSITKTDGATEEVPGTTVTYTIVVTNNGPSDAPGTTVADTFPGILSGVTFTSVAAGGATGNTAAGSGNISDTLNMPSGSSVTYTVSATISASATGTLENTATVTEGAGVTDPTQGNNSATDTDTLTPQADLAITKTDGATDEVPGTSITYTITVTNNGPSDASGVSVVDNFPAALTGVSYTSVAAGGATGNTAGPANGNINDTLNMPTGSSVTYTVNATIASSAVGTLSNTATVTAPGGVTDPTPGNNSATDTNTLTPSADVAVDKTGPATITPGNNITYTISVTNSGPSDAASLSLSDAVPTGTTFVSVTTPAGWTRTDAVPAGGTGTITFTAASLAAGAPASTFTLVVNANVGLADATIITNTVTVGSATADPVPGNNTDSVMTTVQNNADLAITKSVAPTGPNGAGASVTYTIDVINNGPSPATSVTFTDVVPAGLVVNMQTNPSGWSCNSVVGGSGTITCTKSGMASGETAQLTVVATINCGQANGSTINNTATISAVSPADGNTANNTAMASFTVNNPAPIVTASVSMSQLPQNLHELLNVGLMASATDGPCGTPTVTVEVFGDEDDETPTDKKELHSPDAKDIAVGTLRLRAERLNGGGGDGRVYLIVVKATDAAGQTGFATVTVVVPKNASAASIASVHAQAAAAKAFADANNGAPPTGYFVIGDGPVIGPKQ